MAGMPLFGLALLIGLALPSPSAEAADGEELFLETKCNKCHEVKSLDIEFLPPEEEDEARTIIDLSKSGEGRDAEWVTKWLNRKLEKASVKTAGKMIKHKKKWKGTDEDLAVLTEWLLTLK